MINLLKARYSENVVRKALYWISEQCGATIKETDEFWLIALDADDCAFELQRLLNDFLLREKHDVVTKNMRLAIVSAALKRLAEGHHDG